MKINRKLNMVIPIENDGVTLYVHSSPIDRSMFETYFEVISRTFTNLYTGGHGIYSGPRIALMLLRKQAEKMGILDGENGVEKNLIVEMRRLTNVATPSEKGWTYVPWELAIKDGMIDDDDANEVENAIAFFTLASAMHKKADLKQTLEAALSLWGARVELLKLTEFLPSLATLTETESSGANPLAAPSSIPV